MDSKIEKLSPGFGGGGGGPSEAEYDAAYTEAYAAGIPEEDIDAWVDTKLGAK